MRDHFRNVMAMSLLIVLGGVAGAAMSAPGDETAAPSPGMLIVLNKVAGTASLLEITNGKEVSKFITGNGPHEAAVSSDGSTAVVSNYGDGPNPGNSLTVIDLNKRGVAKTISLMPYLRPHGLAYLPDGRHVLVTAEMQDSLLLVDIAEGKVMKNVSTGAKGSHMVVLSPDATRAFVANVGSGSVGVIDIEKFALIKTIPTAAGAEGLDLSPDGKWLWVGNNQAGSVSVIDVEKLEVAHTFPCEKFPIRVKFTPDGKRVLVANAFSGDVAIFDAAERKELKRLTMVDPRPEGFKNFQPGPGGGDSPVPIGITITPCGMRAYISNQLANHLAVIDLEKLEVIERLATGQGPDGTTFIAPPKPPVANPRN